MNQLILRDDKNALVLADLDLSVLHITWKRQVPSQELRRTLIQAYMQVQQHGISHWLTDSRAMTSITSYDEDWIRTDLIPRMFNVGLERVAVVECNDEVHNEQIKRLTDHASGKLPFPVQTFADMDEAFHWMLSDAQVAA